MPQTVELDGGRYTPGDRTLHAPTGAIRLTGIEARLLDFFLQNPGVFVPHERLLEEVWGYRAGVESRTAYTAVYRLRLKIERDAANPVHLRAETGGYRFEPRATTRFDLRTVGRDAERTDLERLVREHRLVTVTGPGGTGKTHLVTSLLAMSKDPLAVGARMVLGDVARDGHDLTVLMLAALGVTSSGDPARAVGRGLRERGRALFVLDNLEQVVGAPDLLATWLEEAPLLSLLVTSRAPLRLRAEHVYRLAPLPLPAPGAARPEAPAIRLFELRAQRVAPEFSAEVAGLEAIADVVRAVDGLPLAIELAAARLQTLPLSALRAGLPRRLDLLGAPAADVPDRHTSVHRTLEWSWNLLDAREQRTLLRLSVFAGGFTLAAAEAVCGVAVEGLLTALVEKSLVRAHRAPDGEVRYDLLVTVATWAAQRLAADPTEDAATRRGHAAWYGGLVEPGAWRTPERDISETRLLLASERANLLAALGWSVSAALDLAGPVLWATYLAVHSDGVLPDIEEAVRRLLALPELPPLAEAVARVLDGILATSLARAHPKETRLASISACRRAGSERLEFAAILTQGHMLVTEGDVAGGLAVYTDGMERMERSPVGGRSLAVACHRIGIAHHRVGRLDEARAALQRAARLARLEGDTRSEGSACVSLGIVEKQSGRLGEAEAWYGRGSDCAARCRDQYLEMIASFNHALLLRALGRTQDAGARLDRAWRLARLVGADVVTANAAFHLIWHIWRDEPERAGELLEEAWRLATAQGQGELVAMAGFTRGRWEGFVEGRLADGVATLERAEALCRETGVKLTGTLISLDLSHLYRQLGRHTEAESAAGRSLITAEELGNPHLLCGAACAHARLEVARGDGPAARSWADVALRHAERGDAEAVAEARLTDAEVALGEGRLNAARAALDALTDAELEPLLDDRRSALQARVAQASRGA